MTNEARTAELSALIAREEELLRKARALKLRESVKSSRRALAAFREELASLTVSN